MTRHFKFKFPFSLSSDKVDRYVELQMQNEKIPGLSLAVVKEGKIIKCKGYGLANVELNVPATPASVYQLGSVGKQFTAELILQMHEQGKLNLDDPINKYLTPTVPAWQKIRIRHLLTHTSGIHAYTATTVSGPSLVNQRLDYTDEELQTIFQTLPLDFIPGEKWSYSDTGYVLLGIIIKNITGEFYGELLKKNIFSPLDMTNTSVINELDIIPNRAAGYWLDNGLLKNQKYVSPSLNRTADGTIYSTVIDLCKLDLALNSEKILKSTSLQIMWSPVELENGKTYQDGENGYYGMGWYIDDTNGHKFVAHYGWWQGFSSYFIRYINDDLSLIILSNLAGARVDYMAKHIAGLYKPELSPHKNCFIQFQKS